MKVAIIGAGNGGAAAAVELTLAGHEVALYGRSPETLAPFRPSGIRYSGVFGEGSARPNLLSWICRTSSRARMQPLSACLPSRISKRRERSTPRAGGRIGRLCSTRGIREALLSSKQPIVN